MCTKLQDHPKDAEYLNTPIRFYTEMEAIFGNALATSRFALGSREALGQNQANSIAAKVDGPPLTPLTGDKAPTAHVEGSKAIEVPCSGVGGKRKRENFSEEEILMLTNMSDAVNNVTNTLRETCAAHVDPDLYLAVMEMHGFTTEALIVAYTYLLEKGHCHRLCEDGNQP